MDLYKRRRGDWVKQSRTNASNEGFQSFPESNYGEMEKEKNRHLTAIELARQKHAAAKAKREKELGKGKGKGKAAMTE